MNNLDDILPKILARGLLALREAAVMPRLVNGDYSVEAAKKGDTINVPIPSAVSTIDVAPSNTPPVPGNTTIETVPIPLNYWRQNDPIHLTDKDLVEIDARADFLPMQMSEAIRALANDVNRSIHREYRGPVRGVFGTEGTAGVTPFGSGVGVKSATQIRKVLNQQVCPKSSRRGVLDFDAEAQALELEPFFSANNTLSADVILEGEIGKKFGIDWVADDEVQTHVAGTIVDGGAARTAAVNNGGGYAIGIDTITIDEGAATTAVGTLVNGDIFTFAGHGQTYCVIDNAASSQFAGVTDNQAGTVGTYTFATNDIVGLRFFPALQTAVIDDEILTVIDDHVVNLVFHRDAFAYATRPLTQSTQDMSLGSKIMSMQDPKTGIVLRLEVSRQHKQVVWEFDLLWGTRLIRAELAARLLG